MTTIEWIILGLLIFLTAYLVVLHILIVQFFNYYEKKLLDYATHFEEIFMLMDRRFLDFETQKSADEKCHISSPKVSQNDRKNGT